MFHLLGSASSKTLRIKFILLVNRATLEKTYRFSGLILFVTLFIHLLLPLKCLAESPHITGHKDIVTQITKRDKITNNDSEKFVKTIVHNIDLCCEQANLFSVYHESTNSYVQRHITITVNSLSLNGLNNQLVQNEISSPVHSPPYRFFSRPVYLVNSTFLN